MWLSLKNKSITETTDSIKIKTTKYIVLKSIIIKENLLFNAKKLFYKKGGLVHKL